MTAVVVGTIEVGDMVMRIRLVIPAVAVMHFKAEPLDNSLTSAQRKFARASRRRLRAAS